MVRSTGATDTRGTTCTRGTVGRDGTRTRASESRVATRADKVTDVRDEIGAPGGPVGEARTTSRARTTGEAGMTTAEYAIGTVAAASFAALLIKLLTSDEVRGLLMGLVRSALSLSGS